jgi:hypothetical protein
MGSAFRSSSLLRVANAVAVTREYGDGNTPTLRTESVSLPCAAIQERVAQREGPDAFLKSNPLVPPRASRTEIAWERYPNSCQVCGGEDRNKRPNTMFGRGGKMQARKWEDLAFIGQLLNFGFEQRRGGTALSAVLFCSCWAQVKVDGKKKRGSQEGGGGKSFA